MEAGLSEDERRKEHEVDCWQEIHSLRFVLATVWD